jgi:hypothetical protein
MANLWGLIMADIEQSYALEALVEAVERFTTAADYTVGEAVEDDLGDALRDAESALGDV